MIQRWGAPRNQLVPSPRGLVNLIKPLKGSLEAAWDNAGTAELQQAAFVAG